jgi:hypothetical protein
MDLAALGATPYPPLVIAREFFQGLRYLVVRHQVHRKWAAEIAVEHFRRGGILLSHMCPRHDLPRDDPERLAVLELRQYGQRLWCGCHLIRELPGYNPFVPCGIEQWEVISERRLRDGTVQRLLA